MPTDLRILVTSEACGGTDREGQEGIPRWGYTDILYLDRFVIMIANICT